MSFVKLDDHHQNLADSLYGIEELIIKLIDSIEINGHNHWFSIGRTDIEKGFMSLRKGLTERFKSFQEAQQNIKENHQSHDV